MKKLLFILLALVSSNLYAAGTNNYYDVTRSGEGITLFEYVDWKGTPSVLFYLYTYGREECQIVQVAPVQVEDCVEVTATAVAECPDSILPPFKPLCDPVEVEVTDSACALAVADAFDATCNDNGQRWFMGFGEIGPDGSTLGPMYITEGLDYPFGVSSPEPFVTDVGEALRVGTFLLRPQNPVFGDGYELWIEPLNPKVEYDGPTLDLGEDDPLFDQIWNMDTPMLPVK